MGKERATPVNADDSRVCVRSEHGPCAMTGETVPYRTPTVRYRTLSARASARDLHWDFTTRHGRQNVLGTNEARLRAPPELTSG
jgi:hypothetical protein